MLDNCKFFWLTTIIFFMALSLGCIEEKQVPPIVIMNPEIDLEKYNIYKPHERLSDPRAEEKEYVFLVIGRDGVELDGPYISSNDGVNIDQIYELENENIKKEEDGFRVTVNPSLKYFIYIDDFEEEIDLAKVEIIKEGNKINSHFIFVATGSGVAHDIVITAAVNNYAIRSTTPITIEARYG